MKKYCTRCGHEFEAVGREVICPSCKAQAAEETKRAAVLRAKRASWTGESVPVRISGRASTVIREYGAANNMPFAQALDALLQASDYFKSTGDKWEEVEPYRSHRRDKNTATSTAETPQDVPQKVKQAAKDKAGKAIHDYLKTLKKEKTLQQEAVKQDAPQASKPQGKAQDAPQEVKQAAKASKSATASKATTSKTVKRSVKSSSK